MGKGKHMERKLRKVNIETGSVSAVSDSLFLPDTIPGLIQDLTHNIDNPIMRKMPELPDIPAEPPINEDISRGYAEVGLKISTNSLKKKKRLQKSADLWEKQVILSDMKIDFDSKEKPLPPADEMEKDWCFREFSKLDLDVFLNLEKGQTSCDHLIQHYEEIKDILFRYPAYEAVVMERFDLASSMGEPSSEMRDAVTKLKTLHDIKDHYDLIEMIMRNKYYSLISGKKIYELPYEELMTRLSELYGIEGEQRNNELIDFYQNLIRLREIGLSDKTSVKARMDEYKFIQNPEKSEEKKADPKKQVKKLVDLYSEMVEHAKKDKTLITETSLKVYKDRFFTIHSEDINDYLSLFNEKDRKNGKIKLFLNDYDRFLNNDFYDSTDTLHVDIRKELPDYEGGIKRKKADALTIRFSAEQMEGLRQVQAYVLDRGIKKGRYAFMHSLLEAPEEQQMLVFYLVENDREEYPSLPECYSALYNYVPDISKFKDKSFGKLSKAIRSSMQSVPVMDKLLELENNIIAGDQTVENNETLNTTIPEQLEQKKNGLVNAIRERSALLILLYRSSGLHPDMPPDMAPDPVLRKRMFQEYKKISELIRSLLRLSPQAEIRKQEYEQELQLRENAVQNEDIGNESIGSSSSDLDFIKEYVLGEGVGIFGGGLAAAGGIVEKAGVSSVLNLVSFGTGGITSLLGAIGIALNIADIVHDKSLSTADSIARWIDVSGDLINLGGGTTLSASFLTSTIGAVGQMASEGGKWLGGTADTLKTVGGSAGTISYVGGALCIGAGTIKLAASGIQVARGLSTVYDVHKAKKTLAEKDAGRLSEDEKIVSQFLKHQAGEGMISAVSAGVGITTGCLGILGGVLGLLGAVTGVFAIIGAAIGLGAVGLEIGNKVISHKEKKANKEKAVDAYLNLDAAVRAVKTKPIGNDRAREYSASRLRKLVREELLAELGFSSWKECYRHICVRYAEILYRKVFIEDLLPDDREMYVNALKSLGMKVRIPKAEGDKPKPTIGEMVSKLMG